MLSFRPGGVVELGSSYGRYTQENVFDGRCKPRPYDV